MFDMSKVVFKKDLNYLYLVGKAQALVEEMTKQDTLVACARDFIYLQGAVQTFTDYRFSGEDADINDLMNVVMGFGIEQFTGWLRENAGNAYFDMWDRAVKSGLEHYAPKQPVDMLLDGLIALVQNANSLLENTGNIDAGKLTEALETLTANKVSAPAK